MTKGIVVGGPNLIIHEFNFLLSGLFLTRLLGVARTWSTERNADSPNGKLFANEPTYDLSVATCAYHWLKKNHTLVEVEGQAGVIDIYVAASEHKPVNK